MKRTRLKLILLLLMGGAIINVEVALGCLIWRSNSWTFVISGDQTVAHRFGVTRVSRRLGPKDAKGQLSPDHIFTDVGFPARSFRLPPVGLQSEAFLAANLLALGLTINIVFYGAVLWTLFVAPGVVKRTIRRRRDLCPACAYPIGTSQMCTECGAQLPLPRVDEGWK